MEVGLALVAEQIIPITDGHIISLKLTANHELVPGSAGRDVYHLNSLILSGKSLAGTGREKEYDGTTWPLGLGPLEAAPPQIIPLQFEEYIRWRLWIETNMALDPGWVSIHWGLRWLDTGGRILLDLPFRSPEVKITWPGRGQFVVDMTPFIRRVYREKIAVI